MEAGGVFGGLASNVGDAIGLPFLGFVGGQAFREVAGFEVDEQFGEAFVEELWGEVGEGFRVGVSDSGAGLAVAVVQEGIIKGGFGAFRRLVFRGGFENFADSFAKIRICEQELLIFCDLLFFQPDGGPIMGKHGNGRDGWAAVELQFFDGERAIIVGLAVFVFGEENIFQFRQAFFQEIGGVVAQVIHHNIAIFASGQRKGDGGFLELFVVFAGGIDELLGIFQIDQFFHFIFVAHFQQEVE